MFMTNSSPAVDFSDPLALSELFHQEHNDSYRPGRKKNESGFSLLGGVNTVQSATVPTVPSGLTYLDSPGQRWAAM